MLFVVCVVLLIVFDCVLRVVVVCCLRYIAGACHMRFVVRVLFAVRIHWCSICWLLWCVIGLLDVAVLLVCIICCELVVVCRVVVVVGLRILLVT